MLFSERLAMADRVVMWCRDHGLVCKVTRQDALAVITALECIDEPKPKLMPIETLAQDQIDAPPELNKVVDQLMREPDAEDGAGA